MTSITQEQAKITTGPFMPMQVEEDLSLKIDQLIECLAKESVTGKIDCMQRRTTKSILKAYAKEGKLTQEQQRRIIGTLKQAHKPRTYENDRRFRGMSVCLTKLGFFSPKLWDILVYPERFPQEISVLQSLSDPAFKVLIQNFYKLDDADISILDEICKTVSVLEIPELEKVYRTALEEKRSSMQKEEEPAVDTSTMEQKIEALRKILKGKVSTNESYDYDQEDNDWDQYARFIQLLQRGDAWKTLTPQDLFKFFSFINNLIKGSPLNGPLRLQVFEKLLDALHQGTLEPKYGRKLLSLSRTTLDLRERLKKDTITLNINGFKFSASKWVLFFNSGYFRDKIRQSVKSSEEISLDDVSPEHFFRFYDLWNKGYDIWAEGKNNPDEQPYCGTSMNLDLPTAELMALLRVAHTLQINKMPYRIAQAICFQKKGDYLVRMAEIFNLIDCPEIEAEILRNLQEKDSWLTIEKQGSHYVATIKITTLPLLDEIQHKIKALKVLKEGQRLSKIVIQAPEGKIPLQSLARIYHLYICKKLGSPEEVRNAQKAVLELDEFESASHLEEWKKFNRLTPLQGVKFLIQLHNGVLKQVCKKTCVSPFWVSLQSIIENKQSKELRREHVLFNKIIQDTSGDGLKQLTGKEIVHFLYFLFDHWKKDLDGLFIQALSDKISDLIRMKELAFETLSKIVEQCTHFNNRYSFPRKLYFDRLNIGVHDVKNDVRVDFPLPFLLKLENAAQVISENILFDALRDIPIASVQWALKQLTGDSHYPKDIRNPLPSWWISHQINHLKLQADHFRALKQLNRVLKVPKLMKKTVNAFSWLIGDQNKNLPAELLCSYTSCVADAYLGEKTTPLLIQNCLKNYGDGTLYYVQKKHHYSRGNQFKMSSLNPSNLEMLKAMGCMIEHLTVEVTEKIRVQKAMWTELVNACANLRALSIDVEGNVEFLDSRDLTKLSKLEVLSLHPKNEKNWKSLESFKIPESIKRVVVSVDLSELKKANMFDFFDRVQAQKLYVDLQTKNLEGKEDLTRTLQRLWKHLGHCKNLSIWCDSKFPLKTLTDANLHLKKLTLKYLGKAPSEEEDALFSKANANIRWSEDEEFFMKRKNGVLKQKQKPKTK